MIPKKIIRYLIAVILALAPVLAFHTVIWHAFLEWDDAAHILNNPHLLDFGYIWTRPMSGMYMPLTFSAWSILMRLFGPNPAAFHLANLCLHVANTLLVYRILFALMAGSGAGTKKSTVPDAALPAMAGALLFALHPLQVETLAWITSLKGLGCACFSLLSIDQYIRHVCAFEGREWKRYALSLVSCAAGLLFHPMAVFVPLALGILNICLWRQRSMRRLLELCPFLLLAAASLTVNYFTQSSLKITYHVPLLLRPLIALDTLGFYWRKLVWPLVLLPAYDRSPRWLIENGALALSWIPALAALAAGFMLRRRWNALWIGELVFIAGTALTLGLVNFGAQDNSTVYDKYVYLAMLGPAFALAAALVRFPKKYFLFAIVVLLCLLAVKSSMQTRIWRNDRTLWTYVLSKNADSPLALINLGYIEGRSGQPGMAGQYYQRALKIKPDDPDILNNYGAILAGYGRTEDAGQLFLRALRLGASNATTLDNLARYYFEKGDLTNAEYFARGVIAREPGHVDGTIRLGEILLSQGRIGECAQLMNHAMADKRSKIAADADAWALLGVALARQGKTAEAAESFRHALQLNPQHANARKNLDTALQQIGTGK